MILDAALVQTHVYAHIYQYKSMNIFNFFKIKISYREQTMWSLESGKKGFEIRNLLEN